MMRSESKEIYGANVFGLVAMLHQLRRWWAIRELSSFWNQDRYCLGICKKFSHLAHHADYFHIQQRYKRIRLYTRTHQQRGVI